MFGTIQKVMFPYRRPRPRGADTELTVVGGASADDVLQEALAGLLRYDPNKLKESWEVLGTRIAHNKAVGALRTATKGRVRGGMETDIVSLDSGKELGDEGAEDPAFDAEAEYIAVAQQQALRRLAEKILTPRDREIYFRVHYLGVKLVDLAPKYNLTAQRIGQIYDGSAEKLLAAAREDPDFLRVSDSFEGGHDDE